MKIQIKNRCTGDVLFELANRGNSIKITLEAGIKSGANLREAYLRGADLRGVDLWGVDLWGASLRGANLRGADLWGANLRGANLGETKNCFPVLYRDNLSILKHQTGKLKAYKYLNRNRSPYQNAEYVVGKTYVVEDYNSDETMVCGKGINLATLEWCLRDTNCSLDKTYIECRFDAKDIVAVPFNTDGKFRVKKLKVVRKITKKELESFLKDGKY